MLSTMLLADAVNKGGPGSGPHSEQGLSTLQNHTGKRVQINQPGSEHHGKVGTILRQAGNESGVDIKGAGTVWTKTENLREV
jgi:hypothetical protein